MVYASLFCLFTFVFISNATPLLYDGRVPFNLTNDDLNSSIGPFLTYVPGEIHLMCY